MDPENHWLVEENHLPGGSDSQGLCEFRECRPRWVKLGLGREVSGELGEISFSHFRFALQKESHGKSQHTTHVPFDFPTDQRLPGRPDRPTYRPRGPCTTVQGKWFGAAMWGVLRHISFLAQFGLAMVGTIY